MRFRLMYLFTFILAAVTVYQFSDNSWINSLFGLTSSIFVSFGLAMAIFFIIMTNTGAAAALRRSRQYGATIGKSFIWIITTGLVCMALVYVANMFYNVNGFSIDSYTRMYMPKYNLLNDKQAIMIDLSNASALPTIIFGIALLAIIFSFMFGYFLKPDLRIIRPAYSVMNSITEVGFRFMGAICKIYIVFLFFISGAFFGKILAGGTFANLLSHTITLITELGVVTGVIVLVILPVFYAIFTKCRENPIPVMWSALITSFISVFSGNILFTLPIMEVIHRTENNAMKKTTVTSGNILFAFGRLGSMVIAYIAMLALTRDIEMTMVSHLLIPLVCFLCSFVCGFFPGQEVLFIVSMLILMPKDIGTEPMVIAGILAPILNLFGMFIDTFAINMGTNALDTPAQDIEALILR